MRPLRLAASLVLALLAANLVATTPLPAQRLKVFISADMEGVAGVVTSDQLGPAGFEYGRFREFMTADEDRFRLWWFGMMNQGVLPAHHFGGDVWTVSIVHTRDDVQANLEAFDRIAPLLR